MYTYLALGDSYTIGEKVASEENFPHQLVRMLNEKGIKVSAPDIIAVTGWTTDELSAAIRDRNLPHEYSFVTLLIGVNNQYRGRSIDNYKEEYTHLLEQAIAFAGGDVKKVFVLSIPDWGVTPFAQGRDKMKIAEEIDAFNAAKEAITRSYGSHWLEITESTREHGTDAAYLAEDGLHYSGKEYQVWAERLMEMVAGEL